MLKKFHKIHFTGIGGYGMSALAFVLLQSGFDVRGSDIKASRLTESLEKAGAKIFLGHGADQVGDAELLIYSTAIPSDNPEIEAARKKHIPTWHRSKLLAALLNERQGIAVAGTHGKTTTSAMVSLLLERGGLDPTAVIGGEVSYFNGNARLGKSPYIVAEACESDHSFLRYRPFLVLLTNIEADHLEHYGGDFNRMVDTYLAFVNNVKEGGTVFYCHDDPLVKSLSSAFRPKSLSYGLSPGADVRGDDVKIEGLRSRFRVFAKEKLLGEILLNVPGLYNVRNALGATAIALHLGIEFSIIKDALCIFEGARRRFEIVGKAGDVLIVDDYAHHPTEIRATLEAARQSGRRIICLFQPHRFTRTHFLWDEFVAAFNAADLLILTDIYSAGEAPIPGITSERLAGKIKERGLQNVYYFDEPSAAVTFLQGLLREGDMVLTMGAGDIWKAGRNLLSILSSEDSVITPEVTNPI
ncbi:MAG: UDP-N-acetylmuramate--L-alanine ligase [Firmicutes bacterium]|nr:UDP-N-acetylmuramate--L-alanine ligase [Bacillota bacterium]